MDAIRDFGVVVSFKDHSTVLGFIANHQCEHSILFSFFYLKLYLSSSRDANKQMYF